jgi:predicted nucleic acid-binding protein
MILADTSVWIMHLKHGTPALGSLLDIGQVAMHPIVLGELACGTFSQRTQILGMLRQIPQVMEAQHEEVLGLIESHRLMGLGLGWSDLHLLTAAILSGIRLWTLDKRLASVSLRFGVHARATDGKE